MGITERKEREKQELKELILLKAKEILMREGQEKMSIRRIAQEAEYSPGTIYLYFQDKDEILHELMEMGFGLMNKLMDAAFAEENPVMRIRKIGEAYVDFGLKHKDWYDLMFVSQQPMNHLERCKEQWGHGLGLFEYLSATCAEAVAGHDDMPISEPRIMALTLWAHVHGLVMLAHAQRLDIVEKEQTQRLIAGAMDGMMHMMFPYHN